MTVIFTAITCLTCFFKADFVNLTACALAIHVLVNADVAKIGVFRLITFMTVCSLVVDFLYLCFLPDNNDAMYQGGEGGVAKFSDFMAWVSFFAKIFMSVVYWKCSLDF